MQTLGDPRKHYWLTLTTAKTCGIDLGEALREGLLTRDEYADTVGRCRSCPEPEACRKWLTSTETAEAPPVYCRNATLFAELRAL